MNFKGKFVSFKCYKSVGEVLAISNDCMLFVAQILDKHGSKLYCSLSNCYKNLYLSEQRVAYMEGPQDHLPGNCPMTGSYHKHCI